MLACTSCGNQNSPGLKFCTRCGMPLAPPIPEPATSFCSNCAASIPPAVRFCIKCGKPVRDIAAQPPPPIPAPPPFPPPPFAPPKPRSGGAVLIVAAVVVLAALGGGGYYGYTRWKVRALPPESVAAPAPAPEVQPVSALAEPAPAVTPPPTPQAPDQKALNPPAPSPPPRPTRPRVPPFVHYANLIAKVQPVYPPLARQARASGTVRLSVVIAEDGSVKEATVISGHPLLTKAAIDAVRQWRYQPTLLNGDPIEVQTEVTIDFTLN